MSEKKQSLKSNIIRVLIANFGIAIVSFVGSFIFPRILTIESYAQYHQFTLYVGYIAVLHLGFPSGMVINYAGKDVQSIDKQQLKTEVSITFFILLFFAIVAAVLAGITKSRMVLYIALVILPYCIVGCYRSVIQAWSQFKVYSRLSMLVTVSVPILALGYYLIKRELTGDVYILTYIIVYSIAMIWVVINILKLIKGVERNPYFTRQNWNTEKTGIAMLAGNYINTLFVSADKQFVNIFFSTADFGFYSFGMSLQSLMGVFITSIAQPLFPAMAQGRWRDEDLNSVKELLFLFGSLSGCAYFAAAVIVKLFIKKYIESLEVIEIYFLIFPAMAVVNCMYVNLYKIKRIMPTYIKTLIGLLALAVVLNLAMVKTYGHYTGVAIATVIVYYCWLFLGTRQFRFLKISLKDLLFLLLYTGLFICSIKYISNDYFGFVLYGIGIVIIGSICYGNQFKKFISMYKREK